MHDAFFVSATHRTRDVGDDLGNFLSLEALLSTESLRERLAGVHAKAASIGLPNPRFDMKAYTDEMWGDG